MPSDQRARLIELVKPNDRLTSTERLNIYHRQYWYRILDSFNEDFPGLARDRSAIAPLSASREPI